MSGQGETSELSMSRWRMVGLAIASEAAILGLATFLGWLLAIPFWDALRIDARDVGLAVVATIPLLAWAIWASQSSWRIFRRINRDFDHVLPMFRNCGVIDLLGISVLAGLGEEALFRGVLQPYLAGHVGVWAAIVLAGVVFGALHAVSGAYVVYASLIGMYLGALYVWSDNLLVPVTVHAVYDFGALVYGVKVHAVRR